MRRVGIVLLIAMLAVFAGNVNAQIALNEEHQKQMVMTSLLSMPLVFMENRGQFGDKAFFKAEAGGASFYFCEDEVAYMFVRDTDELVEEDFIPFAEMVSLPDEYLHPRYKKEVLLIKAKFIGANPDAEAIGLDRLSHYNNYFLGNDPAKWHSNVPNYSAIVYNDIYTGIDLKYYGDGRAMKYDFVIEPGADISQIKIRYEGVEGLSVTSDGKLQAQTSFGLVGEEAPHIYQEIAGTKQGLSGRYEVIEPNVFGFALDEDYDPSYPLIIDPELYYSTYLGGANEDWGYSIAVDGSLPLPNTYVTGYTWSTDFPTEDPYDSTPNGNCDVFVTKLHQSGTYLVYSTYLGGSADDWGYGTAVDEEGYAYVTGRTNSDNFPGAENPNGDFDGFVVKLSQDGGSLDYSTYLGGSSYDACHAIALDGSGCAYVTGMTYSDDFEMTANAYQPDNDGYWDAFVTKFNSAGNNVDYSTYLGGSYIETGHGIAVDGSGNAYVTGWTWSDDFDTTSNAYQDTLEGLQDVFITKLSATDDNLEYSTYLGGSDKDYGKSIAVDGSSGCAYVTGWTWSEDFDTTADPYDGSYNGNCDVFVTKFSSSGDTLYSTYLGGTDEDCGYGITVDGSGCAYVTGRTESTDFPPHGDNTMPDNGMCDVFVTKFNDQGNDPIYSTYLGGNKDDWGYGIAVYDLPVLGECVYVTGKTGSPDFPTTIISPDTILAGPYDAFVTMFLAVEDTLSPILVAVIDSISPDSADHYDIVCFGGHAVDRYGDTIPASDYNWRSDIDGHLSGLDSFDRSELSTGTHNIYFRVQNDFLAWSLEALDTLQITTSLNYPPTAVIDSIKPNPAYSESLVLFGGHGEDIGGDIIDWNWRSDIDEYLSDLASFDTSGLSSGTHTIYFKVQDDSGSWSDETSQTLNIIEPVGEKWQISWWYPSFGDYFDLLMHDFYSCTLFVTNISQTDQIFDFGLDMEYDSLHWLNVPLGVPDWDLEIGTTCLLNGQSYTYGGYEYETIAADETREYVFKISNDWNWVEEWSLTRMLGIVISFMSGVLPPGSSEIYGLYDDLDNFADFIKSPVLIEYTYTAMDDADPAVLSETYNVWVRPEKIFFYWTSWWLGKIASDFTSLGYTFLSAIPPPPGPAIAAACFVAEAVIFACSEKLYVMAVDPVTNYDDYVHPRKPEEIEGYDVMLDAIEEGCGRYIDHKAFELFSMAEAGCSSYVKCVGALKEGSIEWAAKQFASTYCYSKQQASLMQELSSLTQPFVNNIDTPDAAAVEAIIDSLEEGLPDIEVQIMDSIITGFDEVTANALAEILIGAYQNNTGGICSSFVDLPEISDSLNSILQNIFTCSLLVNPLEGVLIGDVVLIDPEIVISGSGTICTVWVEFPGIAFPHLLSDYRFDSVFVNDESGATILDPLNPLYFRDNDHDYVYEIGMVFPPYILEDGKQLQSIFGNVITPAGDTVLPDTVPFSAAALLTVYSDSITSRICGQVREYDNFEPLESVLVEVYDGLDTLVDTTDDEGKFDFPLDPGTYSADFSKPGYHDTTLDELEVAPNETTCVCLVMHAIPDVAVTNVVPSDDVVYQGDLTYIDVTLENQGGSSETFDVTTYYGTMFYDNFESEKPQWTYYAENLEGSAITEINDDIYAQTPTHSLYISNLYGGYQGQNNGIAYAVLNLIELPLTIPYTIEFWFYPSQSDYWPDYNGWKILEADNDITILLHDDPDGIFVIDEDGEHQISYPDFQFQAWHKIKYTRTSANGYILKIDDIERTGDPRGDLLSDVSTIFNFGDTDPLFSKGEGYWDDLIIGSPIETKTVTDLPSAEDTTITFTWNTAGVEPGIYTISAHAHPVPGETDTEDNTYIDGTVAIVPVPIPTLSEWGLIALALLVLAVGTVAVIRKRRAVTVNQ